MISTLYVQFPGIIMGYNRLTDRSIVGILNMGLLKKSGSSHCEECGEVMRGVEHDEAISIYALPMQF